jgi:hypothetical protein
MPSLVLYLPAVRTVVFVLIVGKDTIYGDKKTDFIATQVQNPPLLRFFLCFLKL